MQVVSSLPYLTLLLVLAGCGGGETGSGVFGGVTAPGAAATSTSVARGAASSAALAASKAEGKDASGSVHKLDDNWASVATEGQAFSVVSGTVVQYGSGSQWVQKTVSGSAHCSNEFFGSDPSPSVAKSCFASALGRPARH